jgi:hypothetical protein
MTQAELKHDERVLVAYIDTDAATVGNRVSLEEWPTTFWTVTQVYERSTISTTDARLQAHRHTQWHEKADI